MHNDKNVWFDHGLPGGGDVVGFICAWLESCNESFTVTDALRWLDNMAGYAPRIKSIRGDDTKPKESILVLKGAKPLKELALVQYAESRGIPRGIAAQYLMEVLGHNKDSKKDFFALGFQNEDGGYEIRNKFFKGCIRRYCNNQFYQNIAFDIVRSDPASL